MAQLIRRYLALAIRVMVAISVEAFKNFYPADEYHQDYYLKNPEAFEKELVESGRKKSDT